VREFFKDRLIAAAGIILILILGLVLFNSTSHLSESHPLFGALNYSLVPVLFITGGVVFIIAILRETR
jgi:hypothetical protein